MATRIIPIDQQGKGAFNGGQIIENKPIGFPTDGGFVRPISTLFYWARAEAIIDSTIGKHPHQGFEIMSFVLEGAIRHFDTKNNAWIPLKAGDVQIIRAGDGIEHAEHMEKGAVIFQIWVDPDLSQSLAKPASYDDYQASEFEIKSIQSGELINYAGEGGPMKLDTNLEINRYQLTGDHSIPVDISNILAAYVIDGNGMVGDYSISQHDFIIIDNVDSVLFGVDGDLDLFTIRVPASPGYRTYAERFLRHA